jgi:hypothetical protein
MTTTGWRIRHWPTSANRKQPRDKFPETSSGQAGSLQPASGGKDVRGCLNFLRVLCFTLHADLTELREMTQLPWALHLEPSALLSSIIGARQNRLNLGEMEVFLTNGLY